LTFSSPSGPGSFVPGAMVEPPSSWDPCPGRLRMPTLTSVDQLPDTGASIQVKEYPPGTHFTCPWASSDHVALDADAGDAPRKESVRAEDRPRSIPAPRRRAFITTSRSCAGRK